MRCELSCCIVVKNEEDKILNCLNNLTILADEIIIIDTGSTDLTPTIINNFIQKNKAYKTVFLHRVGSKFHDDDGDFNFGEAKNYAFDQATKDYVMWLDANDIVSDQVNLKKSFIEHTSKNKNIYITLPTELSDKFAFIRARIAPRLITRMKGRIHEYLTVSDVNTQRVFIPIPIKNIKKEGRNLERNLRQLMKEWNQTKDGRICFYIALTYHEMLKTQDALDWFKRRVYGFEFTNEFIEEYFKAYEMIGDILIKHSNLKHVHEADLFDIAEEMIKLMPNRYEGYYYLAHYYMKKNKYDQAIKMFRKFNKCKMPDSYSLWLNKNIYNRKSIKEFILRCETAIKYQGVLKPTEIIELNAPKSTLRIGNNQYL